MWNYEIYLYALCALNKDVSFAFRFHFEIEFVCQITESDFFPCISATQFLALTTIIISQDYTPY